MVLKFIKKQHEVDIIYSFFFESDDLSNWIPGEYFNLTMSDVPPVYADRLFSIASAPHEKLVRVTTWIGPSPFKQRLVTLKEGEFVEADQLGGDFTLDPAHSPVISAKAGISKRLFLAGGIGITPYRAMIIDAMHSQKELNTVLLWSGRPDGMPFLNEIKNAIQNDSSSEFKVFINERLDIKKIQENVPDVNERIIYLAGSQPFVDGLGEALMTAGIPRSQLKYDWFDGYSEL